MKQAELNKLLGASIRAQARDLEWSTIGGFAYQQAGPLFFVLVATASAREAVLHWSLRVKWTEMDSELWRLLGMHGNLKEPTSLRANGAFSMAGHEIAWSREEHCTWSEEGVRGLVRAMLATASRSVSEFASGVSTLEEFMQFAEDWYADLLRRSPRAAVTLWRERLLYHLLKDERQAAVDIAQQRIQALDSGGFTVDGRTFFEHAERYAQFPV